VQISSSVDGPKVESARTIPAAMPEPKLYSFSTHIGAVCTRKMVSFVDLADRLKMDVTDLMRQCNAKTPPSKALIRAWPVS
jgi:hypothetical protein